MKFDKSFLLMRRTFFLLAVLVAVPALVLGFLSSRIFIKQETEQKQKSVQYNLEILTKEVDAKISMIRQYYVALSQSGSFTWILDQKSPPYREYSELKKVQQVLQGNNLFFDSISSYCFFNKKYKWVLSNYGLYALDDIINRADIEKIEYQFAARNSNVVWINNINKTLFGSNMILEKNTLDTSGILLCINHPSGDFMIMLKLKANMFVEMRNLVQSLKYDICVFVDKKIAIGEDTALYSVIHANTQKTSDFLIYSQSSKESGWSYSLGYDTTKTKQISKLFYQTAFIIVVISIFSIIFIRIIYIYIYDNIRKTQNTLTEQNRILKSHFLENLLLGKLSEEAAREGIANYTIRENFCYRLLQATVKQPLSADYTALLTRIRHKAETVFPEDVHIESTLSNDSFVFVISDCDEEKTNTDTQLFFVALKDIFEGEYHTSLILSCSRIFYDLASCNNAFKEITAVMPAAFSNTNTNISNFILCDDYINEGFTRTIWDNTIEAELCNAVEKGKTGEAFEIVDLIINRLTSKNLTGIDRSYYISRICNQIITVPFKQGIALSAIFLDKDYETILARQNSVFTKTELTAFFKELIQPIIQKITEVKNNSDSIMLTQIYTLITEAKGDITLYECADALKYHPNTISKVLKEQKGTTFSQIINDLKLRQAKYLLLTTDLSINEIAEKLNYSNVQNFARFFKRYVGETPSEFKKTNSVC